MHDVRLGRDCDLQILNMAALMQSFLLIFFKYESYPQSFGTERIRQQNSISHAIVSSNILNPWFVIKNCWPLGTFDSLLTVRQGFDDVSQHS